MMWWAESSCGRACIYCATSVVPIESSRRWSKCEIEWKSILLPAKHAELSKIWELWTQFCLLKWWLDVREQDSPPYKFWGLHMLV